MYNQIDLNYINSHQNFMLKFSEKERSLRSVNTNYNMQNNIRSFLIDLLLTGFRFRPGNLLNKLTQDGKQPST